jgi:signal transduction histidine kinase
VTSVSAFASPEPERAARRTEPRQLDPRQENPDLMGYLAGPRGLDLVVEMAHDLRSPLSSILVLAQSLRDGQAGAINEAQRRHLGLIYSAALYLCSTASDVTEMARGGTHLHEPAAGPFSVREMLLAVRDMVRPMAEEKDLRVELEFPWPDERVGHSRPLSRALLNLATNALKFTERGHVAIGGRATSPSRIEFWVQDTGPGMSETAVANVYAPVRRAPTLELRHHFSSSGLGLAITRKVITAMGSLLHCDTTPGVGTRFRFELELPPVDGATP